MRASISHAEGREYYYFDLLHPPAFDECLGLSLFRAVRRTRHVIIPPQYCRSNGGRNEISKTLQKKIFFRTSFPPKKSVYPRPRIATVICVVVVVSSRHRGRHMHTWRGGLPILFPRPYRIGSIVHVCVHASCRYIINTIPSSRLCVTVGVYPNDGKFLY